jgi:alpha-galactosidase
MGGLHWRADGALVLRSREHPTSELVGGFAVEVVDAHGRAHVARALPRGEGLSAAATSPFTAHGGGAHVWQGSLAATVGDAPADGARLAVDVTLVADTAAALEGLVRQDAVLRNTGAVPITLRRAFPLVAGAWWPDGMLRLGGHSGNYAAYKSGWQSWSYAGGLPPGISDPRSRVPTLIAFHHPDGTRPEVPFAGKQDMVSEEMALLGRPGEEDAALVGFLSAERWFGQVFARRRGGALAAAVLLDDLLLPPGASVALPPLVLGLGAPAELLRRYADAVGAALRARAAHRPPPTGWSSWYYYFTGVDEAAVKQNIGAATRLRASLPLDLIQIDDGYQEAVGDWLSVNDKFPGGMAPLAARIRDAGMRPGIWLAPFTVGANSTLAREHPDWLVHDASGRPVFAGHNWDTTIYGLDTTHPGAREWLRTVISTLVRDWGYDYLKLDFLATAAVRGQRYDASATRASALRDGLRLIRETAGEDVLLLGCGCPLVSAVGIVDAMRIGPDSAPYWQPRYMKLPLPFGTGHSLPHLHGALRNTLTRAWMAPAWWVNDPDCLLVRERHSELTEDEVLAFATAVGLTGSMVVVSDRLADLSPERLAIVQRLVPPLPERALPADVFGFNLPERVQARIVRPWGEWLLIGLFNGTRIEREMPVSWGALGLAAGMYHAVEFWSGAYLGCSAVGVTPRVAPHGVAALTIRRDTGAPLLLSSSFHIGQGAVEIATWSYDTTSRTVRWRAEIGKTMAGTFTLWLPENLRPRRLAGTARELSWRRLPDGVVVVSARIQGAAEFTLELESGT